MTPEGLLYFLQADTLLCVPKTFIPGGEKVNGSYFTRLLDQHLTEPKEVIELMSLSDIRVFYPNFRNCLVQVFSKE